MASCEIVLDISNYTKIPTPPTRDDREKFGDEYFNAKQREFDLAKRGNETKKRFFLAVRWFLDQQLQFKDIPVSIVGDDTSVQEGLRLIDASKKLTEAEKARFFTIAGILLADSQLDPLAGKTKEMLNRASGDVIDETDPAHPVFIAAPFKAAMTRALAEYNMYPALFERVYTNLKEDSATGKIPDPKDSGKSIDEFKFKARQIAIVGRILIGERVDPRDPQFGARFKRALSQTLSGANDGPPSTIDIDLPDLEAGTDADIIIDNVKALAAIYFSAQLEELKFFAVMDKIVEQFMNGTLPIKRSTAGDPLYRYHREAQIRINEFERRGLYARSFGVAQGSIDEPTPNREFSDLWIRFISAVSIYGREMSSTELKRVSQEQVFKTARDLAVNLSLHGFGLAHFAAIELQNLIRFVKETLSNADVLAAYGVRDVWQLVERVSNMYLGGAVNGVRQRTMATSGANIMKWLANSAPNLITAYGTVNVDRELISQCEAWLAVTGTPDTQTEKYSEPISLSNQRTIPDFAMPAGPAGDAIRAALDRVNLPSIPQA
jgi:hypothetical protein